MLITSFDLGSASAEHAAEDFLVEHAFNYLSENFLPALLVSELWVNW